MAENYQPTSDARYRERPSSPLARARLELGAGVPPPTVRPRLPERYGVPLLELLVVDTEHLFVSWEITAAQLDAARAGFGETAYLDRRLVLRLSDVADRSRVVGGCELYGETGRWFFRHDLAGRQLWAALVYASGDHLLQLNATGPLAIPRNYVVEPANYEELTVGYAENPDGSLRLIEASRREDAAWPAISLPADADVHLRRAAAGSPSSLWGGSAGLPLGSHTVDESEEESR